jgi:hypothetical protein
MDAAQDGDGALLLTALTRVVDSGAASRPGQLRSLLESELGRSDALRLRGRIHQLVVAAEEHVPSRLSAVAPLTAESRDRVAGDLASARGWSRAAAGDTTRLWSLALGLAVAEPAPEPLPARPPEAARPAPGSGAAPFALAATSLPATSLPRPAAVASGSDSLRTGPPSWPIPAKRIAGLKQPDGGRTALSSAMCSAGIGLSWYALWILALLALCICGILLAPVHSIALVAPLITLVAVATSTAVTALLGRGVVIATHDGLEHTRCDLRVLRPRLETTRFTHWAQVSVEPGWISTVRLPGRRLQLGPRNRAFAAAAAAAASGAVAGAPAEVR